MQNKRLLEIYSSLEGSGPQNENQHLEDEGKQADQDRRQSQRQKRPPVRFGLDEYAYMAATGDDVHHLAYHVSQVTEPTSLDEALTSDHAK